MALCVTSGAHLGCVEPRSEVSYYSCSYPPSPTAAILLASFLLGAAPAPHVMNFSQTMSNEGWLVLNHTTLCKGCAHGISQPFNTLKKTLTEMI